MLKQFKLVAVVVALTVGLLYAPAGWRLAVGGYNALVKAEQIYMWLSGELAQAEGKSLNRATVLDCVIRRELTRRKATDINPAFLADTGGCSE